jgi:hypothetical protein
MSPAGFPCERCGKTLPAGSQFCGFCGSPVVRRVTPPPANDAAGPARPLEPPPPMIVSVPGVERRGAPEPPRPASRPAPGTITVPGAARREAPAPVGQTILVPFTASGLGAEPAGAPGFAPRGWGSPPGLPAAPRDIGRVPLGPSPPLPEDDPGEDLDEPTSLASPQGRSMELRFESGRTVPVTSPGLIGRDPQSKDSSTIVVAVDDLSISKAHLEFGLDDEGRVWVMDRGSTNGSTLVRPGREAQALTPRQRATVAPGDIVTFGDRRLWVREVGR